MFYKPATVEESFYVPSELAGSVSLPLGFCLKSQRQTIFSLPVTFSPPSPAPPFYSFLNLVTELTLQTQDQIECHHFAIIKFCLLCFVWQHW